MRKYNDDFLISELKRFVEENGKIPSYNDMCSKNGYPSSIVYAKHFGSWNNALKLVGFETYKQYTNKELLDELYRFVEENDRVPTTSDFNSNKNFPSSSVYQKRFGSWNDALIEAKIEINKICKYDNEFLISELNRYTKENNKIPIEQDFKDNKSFPHPGVYEKHFGTWNNALKEAGLEINKGKLTGNEICYICKTDKTSQWNFKKGERICNKCYFSDRNYLHGILNPESPTGIGVITEHIVYKILGDCEKCNTIDNFDGNYDLISDKYGNINVKSSVLHKQHKNSYYWAFNKHKNAKIPDYYICLGFNKNRSEILKVWIIPYESKIVYRSGIRITNSENSLNRALQYEVDSSPYNNIYKNLDIYTLSEFKNLNIYNTNDLCVENIEE